MRAHFFEWTHLWFFVIFTNVCTHTQTLEIHSKLQRTSKKDMGGGRWWVALGLSCRLSREWV